MTKIDAFRLRKVIPSEEFDYQMLSDALAEYQAHRQKIHELLKNGVITRVKKGLYVFGLDYSRVPACPEVLANLIYGPSCLSLEYALSHYGLIPERVHCFTSVTPKRDKEFDTPLGRFTYRYLALPKYSQGIEQVWIDPHHPVLMASPEKALCDYVALSNLKPLGDRAAARDFLEFDLRIDPADWKRFDSTMLGKFNEFYRNDNIERIREAL